MSQQEAHAEIRRRGKSRTLYIVEKDPDLDSLKRSVIEVLDSAKRIQDAPPRNNGGKDAAKFKDFAERIRRELLVAATDGDDTDIKIPGPNYISMAIAQRIGPLPGFVLIMTPNKSGFDRRLVGGNYAPRIVRASNTRG